MSIVPTQAFSQPAGKQDVELTAYIRRRSLIANRLKLDAGLCASRPG